MNLIESNFDNILDAGYKFYSTTLLELKKEATSWYSGIDFEKFDNRWQGRNDFEAGVIEMKLSGLLCNLFFAYKSNDKLYLMDGFNRLFTNYGKVSDETIVYLKVITTQLPDHELMLAMAMKNQIKLQKNNDNRADTDLQWLEEFYEFLKGSNEKGMRLGKKLSPNQAYSVIYYLQEHLPVFPDTIEKCSVCNSLYDSNSSGHHSEKTAKHYCDNCEYIAPSQKEEDAWERRQKKKILPE